MIRYPAIDVTPKTGDEVFRNGADLLDMRLVDFWRWNMSDLSDNVIRGRLAEFLVCRALGLASAVRDAWGACDVRTASGLELQVKSCAYLQSWGHEKLSEIRFDVRPKRAWTAATNQLGTEVKRHARAYVFCLQHHQDKATLDPLNLEQWTFYLLSTEALETRLPSARTVSLSRLLSLNPTRAAFASLAIAVQELERETNASR
jgi:hypothetical protein